MQWFYTCSSITRDQKVVTTGDTVFVNSTTPSEPFVAEIKSFHENLTDQQACADIFWYYGPQEMKKLLAKIPKGERPSLPPLLDSEVVVSNVRDTIEVSTICGPVHVQKVGVSIAMEGANVLSDPVAHYRYDSNQKSVVPLVSTSPLGSYRPGKHASGAGFFIRHDSEFNAESPGKRVRFRSKGSLRPEVHSSRFNRTLLSPQSRRATCLSGGKEKKFGYLDLLHTNSQPLPKLVCPSTISDNSLPHQQCDVLSHDCHIASPTKSSDQLASDPLVVKRSIPCSPENWVGKQSPNIKKKLSDDTELSGGGISKRSPERSLGISEGSPGAGKGAPLASKTYLLAAKRSPVACKKLTVTCNKSPISRRSLASLSSEFSGSSAKRKLLSNFDVYDMIFEDDSSEKEEVEEQDDVDEESKTVQEKSKASKPDYLLSSVVCSEKSSPKQVYRQTRSRVRYGGNTDGNGKESKESETRDADVSPRKSRGQDESALVKDKMKTSPKNRSATPIKSQSAADVSARKGKERMKSSTKPSHSPCHTPSVTRHAKKKVTSKPIRSSSRKKTSRLSSLAGMDSEKEPDSGSYVGSESETDDEEDPVGDDTLVGEKVDEWTPKLRTMSQSRRWAEGTPKSSKRGVAHRTRVNMSSTISMDEEV